MNERFNEAWAHGAVEKSLFFFKKKKKKKSVTTDTCENSLNVVWTFYLCHNGSKLEFQFVCNVYEKSANCFIKIPCNKFDGTIQLFINI